MKIRKKDLTIEDRLHGTFAAAEAATTVIADIVVELEATASEQGDIALDIDESIGNLQHQIRALETLRSAASDAQAEAVAKAEKFRALLSA